jgi:hypothetical protein
LSAQPVTASGDTTFNEFMQHMPPATLHQLGLSSSTDVGEEGYESNDDLDEYGF